MELFTSPLHLPLSVVTVVASVHEFYPNSFCSHSIVLLCEENWAFYKSSSFALCVLLLWLHHSMNFAPALFALFQQFISKCITASTVFVKNSLVFFFYFIGSLDNQLLIALLLNKVDFVQLLLNQGIMMSEFLTRKRLLELYEKVGFTVMSVCLTRNCTENGEKNRY